MVTTQEVFAVAQSLAGRALSEDEKGNAGYALRVE